MTAADQAEHPVCEHYWAYHVHDGLSVRLCQLCHWPDWDDLRGQLGEAERKGSLAELERWRQIATMPPAEFRDRLIAAAGPEDTP